MRKAIVFTGLAVATLFAVYSCLRWWCLQELPAISSPIDVTVYRDCRPSDRITLTNADKEFSILREWIGKQQARQYTRSFVSFLPDVVLDCAECEINLRHNGVVLSVKDDPQAWSQYEKAVSADDLRVRNAIVEKARRITQK